MISRLGQWSPHWKGGSWRSAGWSGSAWWSRRSSSCRCRWPGRSCCQKAWSIKSEIYRFPRETFNRNIVFWGHKKVQKSMPISAEMYDALKNNCHLKQPIRFADLPAELFSSLLFLYFIPLTCVFSPQLPPPARPPAWPRGWVRLHSFLEIKFKKCFKNQNHRLRARSRPTGNQSGSRRDGDRARPDPSITNGRGTPSLRGFSWTESSQAI